MAVSHKLLLLLCSTLLLVILPTAVKADPIVLTLNPLQGGIAGSILTFQGTFSNGGAPALFVNSVSLTLVGSPSGFTFDPSDFFAAVPLSVDAGFTVGPTNFFTVSVSSAVASGSYRGSFTVLGGDVEDDEIPLASQEFTIQIHAVASQVPEPATLFMLGAGLTGLATVGRQRRKSK